nr:hypothetical protein [Tanacetum cinerariifolium]
MDTLSLVSEYLKDLEECIDDGDSKIAKESKLFDALEYKSVVIEVDNQKIAIFTKAPLRAFGEPFMRYSIPCKVDGKRAWDAELDLADSANYVTEEVLENMDFVYINFSNYGRKIVNDVNVEIHGVKFKADFVVLDYVNEEEPSIVFGRDFLVTTKSQINFGLGEIRINLTKFKEGIEVINLTEEVGSSNGEVVKMGKANRNKSYNINKLTPSFLEARRNSTNFHCSTTTDIPSLTPKQKEKVKKALDIKHKELEESKPIIEVLENYVIYKKKLDEILIGKERLNKKEFSEEDNVRIIKHGFPKKMCDPVKYVLSVKINGVVEMVALVDTEASAFEMEGEVDWLGSFEVGRDEDGNVKYGPVAPSFIDIEDDIWGNEGYGSYKKVDGDGDVFVDYSWERALLINDEIYPEWVLEFFSTFYFDKDVDKTNLMKGKYVVEHSLFEIYFGKLEVDDKQFDHKDYWTRFASMERCQKWDLWMMSALEESCGVNLDWMIADHLYKYASRTKENSVICAGYYVTRITSILGYCVDDEIKKCSELINCKYWTSRMLADELDEKNTCLKKEAGIPTQAAEGSNGQRQKHEDFGGSSLGYAVVGSSKDAGFNDDDMDE